MVFNSIKKGACPLQGKFRKKNGRHSVSNGAQPAIAVYLILIPPEADQAPIQFQVRPGVLRCDGYRLREHSPPHILGYQSISDLRDFTVTDVFNNPAGRQEPLDDLQKNRFVKNRILHLKKPDGSPFSVNVTALAEFDDNRNIVFIKGIVQDITHILAQNTGSG